MSWHAGDRFGPDALFDGTQGELSTCAPAVDPWRDFSIAFWVNPTSYRDGIVVAQDGINSAGFMVYVDSRSHDWIFAMANGDTPKWDFDFSYGPAVRLNAWTQITVTHDRSSLSLYVNGDLSYKITHTQLDGYFTGNFNIGADYLVDAPSGDHFAGQIADVRVRQVCLPQPQVTALRSGRSVLGG